MNRLIIGAAFLITLCWGTKIKANENNQLKNRISLIESEAYRLAIDDIKKNLNNFNSKKYLKVLKTFETEKKKLIQGINNNDKSQIEKATMLVDILDEGLLSNPLLDFDKILILRRDLGDKAKFAMSGDLGIVPSNFETNAGIPHRNKDWKNEISVLSNIRSGGQIETIFKPKTTKIINDLCLNFDGKELMFSSIGTNGRWHLFVLNTQNGKIEQITPDDITDFDCFDGCFLPNGKITFCSTATFLGLPCTNGGHRMCGLFLIDRDSKSIRQLTFDQDSNWEPVVMNNGKVQYQRWEYAGLPHSNSRIIFSMNPDGTSQLAEYGSNSYFPTAFFGARPIPNHSSSFVGVASGHHSVSRAGRLMIIDPSKGRHEADGVVAEIPHRGRKVQPIVRDRLPDGVWPLFMNPYPLSDKYFLVSMKKSSDALWGLYLVDVFNNMTLLYEKEGEAVIEAHPFTPRTTPMTIPDRVNLDKKTATVFLQNVYHGPGLKGIKKGEVKKLRIGSYFFSPYGQGGLLGTLGMDGPWDIMRILGTVPIEKDGSAMFNIPANTPVFVQPLDEDGKALQQLRSWFTAMPGETVSCIGCHENRNEVALTKRTIASRKKPAYIQEWYGAARSFSFKHEIQPILDKRCIACHNEQHAELPYLKGDKMLTNWSSQIGGHASSAYGGHFSKSYANLHKYVRRPGIESDMHLLTPMDFHADQTELIQILKKGHHNVELDKESLEKLYCWIDLNAPYHGERGDIPCNDAAKKSINRIREIGKKYANTEIVFDDSIISKSSEKPIMPKSYPELPNDDLNPKGWPFPDNVAINKQIHPRQEYQKEILVDNGLSIKMVKIPNGEFLMGGDGHRDEKPKTAVKIDKAFWIGQFEITNELYALFDPSHDSRDEHRHGYQFGRVGYPLNKPTQPVVRVSWQEAMNFCKWLSNKTGHKFTLPTESQWEWACRAGKSSEFFFGDKNANFTNYANLGDKKLAEFAACTSYKFYESARIIENPNEYDDWIPRDTNFNDAGFVSEEVGRYRANVWDINDMHGNVWEWTRSDYKPYPYNAADGRNNLNLETEKVVRGGSWYARPKRSTSSYRLPYRTYQKVFDVGFRVIIEE
jgi:formylglycine-generating enzyme required for sulfatase activity